MASLRWLLLLLAHGCRGGLYSGGQVDAIDSFDAGIFAARFDSKWIMVYIRMWGNRLPAAAPFMEVSWETEFS